ncbi:MAG: putative large multi-functional protein [Nitrospira sp.]
MRTWWEKVLVLCLLLIAPTVGRAQDRPGVFTDPTNAGPDLEIQGEYLGMSHSELGEGRWGAQVTALGQKRFHLVLFSGGLPGQGGQPGDRSMTADGISGEDGTTFHLDSWHATIKQGVLTLYGQDQSQMGALTRIERKSPTLGSAPPPGAVVLFDGNTAEAFTNGKIVMKNLLAADAASRQTFGDHLLHLEFRVPFKPEARGQGRGNSGVYLQNRYELQILDSFGFETGHDECGGIYSIAAPSVNMSFPPLTWQTYDVDFTAARFDQEGKKQRNARVTVRHNGVVIHDDLELSHGTPGRAPEGPLPDVLYLQGHGDPVVFRHIWVVSKGDHVPQ